jgi:hypothetical protein
MVARQDPLPDAWWQGKTRCRMHGGKSTGPRTEEGKARVVAAMVEGRRKWADKMKELWNKFPCGPQVRI